MLRTLTATELFDHLTGANDIDSDIEYDDEKGDKMALDDSDSFDTASEDDDDDPSSSSGVPSTTSSSSSSSPAYGKYALHAKLAGSKMACRDDECSICLGDFDGMAAQLECGHSFCTDCVASYIRVQLGESPKLHHQVSVVSREGEAVVVQVFDAVGVKCPHFGCGKLIREDDIRAVADDRTWEQFNSMACDEAVAGLLVNGELEPCPRLCGGFLQDNCLCINAECRQIQLREQELRERRRLRDARLSVADVCQPKPDERLCPHCYVRIEKNGGCDHMHCSRCKQNFLWSRARRFVARNANHWMIRHNQTIKILTWK